MHFIFPMLVKDYKGIISSILGGNLRMVNCTIGEFIFLSEISVQGLGFQNT